MHFLYSLRQVNDQLLNSVSFCAYTLLCVESWSTDSWGVVPKLGEYQGILRGVKYHCLQCKWQFERSGKISEFHICFRPSRCRPLLSAARGGCPPSPPFRRHCWYFHILPRKGANFYNYFHNYHFTVFYVTAYHGFTLLWIMHVCCVFLTKHSLFSIQEAYFWCSHSHPAVSCIRVWFCDSRFTRTALRLATIYTNASSFRLIIHMPHIIQQQLAKGSIKRQTCCVQFRN